MSETAAWQLLNTETTQKFIEAVKDAAFSGLFDGAAYALYARDLSFFGGYSHYQLCNKAMIPYFTLEYISNGEDHFYLDGSEHPLELLIQKDALNLSTDNVLDYLQFHNDVAFYPYRKVKFILNPQKTPYAGASAMEHHFKALKYHAEFELQDSPQERCFFLRLPVLYNGETVNGRVQVLYSGEITVLEPVHIPLMDRSRQHAPLDYDHPHEKTLLKENVAILTRSAAGKRLYETITNHGGEIRFLSGVGSAAFAPRGQLGYVVAPENVDTASPYQILALADVLREMELLFMGETRGDPGDESEERAGLNIGRNLDILLHSCMIHKELADDGYGEALKAFKKMGFEALYSGYIAHKTDDELLDIYAEILDRRTGE